MTMYNLHNNSAGTLYIGTTAYGPGAGFGPIDLSPLQAATYVSDGFTATQVQAGSTGLDYSANTPTLPVVGANFAASGPYASYVLITTVPAGARNNVDIENTSGAQIAIVRDDGTAASGSAPANASVFALTGTTAGTQGGSYTNATFKGRLQIYAPVSSAQVAVMVD